MIACPPLTSMTLSAILCYDKILQYRIVFAFENGNAYDVSIVDCH